jgi:hypothetical protein
MHRLQQKTHRSRHSTYNSVATVTLSSSDRFSLGHRRCRLGTICHCADRSAGAGRYVGQWRCRGEGGTAGHANGSFLFIAGGDPVGDGLVQSLAHPGGNLTGFAVMEPSLGAKLLGMLKQVAPQVTRVGTLVNPDSLTHQRIYALLMAAAPSFAVEVVKAPAPTRSAALGEAELVSVNGSKPVNCSILSKLDVEQEGPLDLVCWWIGGFGVSRARSVRHRRSSLRSSIPAALQGRRSPNFGPLRLISHPILNPAVNNLPLAASCAESEKVRPFILLSIGRTESRPS